MRSCRIVIALTSNQGDATASSAHVMRANRLASIIRGSETRNQSSGHILPRGKLRRTVNS